MKFSISQNDELFGERLDIEVPGPDGQLVKRSVTKKWFESMQAQGKISRVTEPMVQVHILHALNGYFVDHWVIGKDVDATTVATFQDAATHALYGITYLRGGNPETKILTKADWEKAKSQLGFS